MQVKGSYKTLFLICALSTLGTGCSTWFSNDFAAPQVQLVDAELVQAKLLEQQFKLYFRIDNPNSSSLPIRGIDYQVQINDVELGKGYSSNWKTVPANGHSYYQVTAYTNIWRQIRNLVRVLETPDQPISYALEIKIKTGMLHKKHVELSHQGSFTLGDYLQD